MTPVAAAAAAATAATSTATSKVVDYVCIRDSVHAHAVKQRLICAAGAAHAAACIKQSNSIGTQLRTLRIPLTRIWVSPVLEPL